MKRCPLVFAALLTVLAGCGREAAPGPGPDAADADGHSAPSAQTAMANQAVAAGLASDDGTDFADARRGLIATPESLHIEGAAGGTAWDMDQYGFLAGEAPASVNPSLWRQARLNAIHGLFEVTGGIYQLRGFDISNMTLIAGKSGWIVVDPLTTRETAAAAIAFARRHLGEQAVSAVIYTHSHVDHFGGVLGVIDADDARARGVPVIAPSGFMEEATSENILAGTAMLRRATYMYGTALPRSPRGHVDTGLGKGAASGSTGLIAPTVLIEHTGQELEIDGVRFVFQDAPGSEAPAEITFYLPDRKAFCGAEIVSHTMHNLYTLRGAKVRDALKWSGYIDEAITRFGAAEVFFASHHWPLWGRERIVGFLEQQRDTYRYIHDQTLRLASQGFTGPEIADQLRLPASLLASFANHGYYGTVRHNARAVYQFYFGWYDANPAHLDPLPPVEAARKYLEFMGGAQAVLAKAGEAFARGEYRWVAEVVNHVVFAEPGNAAAKELLARAYDQLGYQAESGPWRDVYLSGARELRHGVTGGGRSPVQSADMLRNIPLERFLDALAVQLDGPRAEGRDDVINLVFTDTGETHVLELKNAVLHHRRAAARADADATLKLPGSTFLRMLGGALPLRETLLSDAIEVEGNRLDLIGFFLLFDRPDPAFPIVTP